MFHNYLINSFAFYGAYHRNKVNQVIHQVTIPLIVWTVMVFTGYYNFYIGSVEWLPVNITVPLMAFYVIVYFLFDVPSALVITPILFGMYVSANLFIINVQYAWAYALGIHFVAWIIQFAGHGVWEKRRPALTESLLQAFLMAPIFVVIELMFACGCREDLKDEIDRNMTQYLPINLSDD